MGVDVTQHIALRVADIDRAARFYVEVFDGRYLTRPFTLSGPELEPLFGGHEGLEVRVCLLAFEKGSIELFEFLHPRVEMGELDQTRANLVHWCVQVDDVGETLARVEGAGGKAVHPVLDWGGTEVVYCTDLDGNIFELISSTMEETAARSIAMFPEAAP
jgi:catechol 2,3-dioxygenase-like lactoylglutathione lyase family enzyme